MKEIILQYVVPPLLTGLAGLAAWGLTNLARYLAAKTSNATLNAMIVRVGDAVATAVRHVEQTMRPKVASALADGELSDVEARDLRNAALAAVKDELGALLGPLAQFLGLTSQAQLDAYLTRRIEAAVNAMTPTNGRDPR